MVDLTEHEQQALRAAMKPVGEIMEEIGWGTPLADLTQAQVLTLIEAAVGGFQDTMHKIAADLSATQGQEVPF